MGCSGSKQEAQVSAAGEPPAAATVPIIAPPGATVVTTEKTTLSQYTPELDRVPILLQAARLKDDDDTTPTSRVLLWDKRFSVDVERKCQRENWPTHQQDMQQLRQQCQTSPGFADRAHEFWSRYQGHELQEALLSGAIALLDAQWLVDFAYSSADASTNGNDGDPPRPILSYRQQLPPEAFLSAEQVVQCTSLEGGIQIISLSYMWLSPRHPDPYGDTLQVVAHWLHKKLLQSWEDTKEAPGLDFCFHIPRWAVFWDFASLYQHPSVEQGIYRTKSEQALFQQGLESLATLFSHPYTTTFQVTQLPRDYPQGYHLPPNSNVASYFQRGWPFVENAWINLVKDQNKTFDISQTGHQRPAPSSPERVNQLVKTLSFTNAKDDQSLVARLYQQEFARRFGEMNYIRFSQLHFTDDDIVQINEILEKGYMPKLEILWLNQNQMELKACRALHQALQVSLHRQQAASTQRGTLLNKIDLSLNRKIGNAGIVTLAPSLVQIADVDLANVGAGVDACRALVDGAASAAPGGCSLQRLNLSLHPNMGNPGLEILIPLALTQLKDFSFSMTNITHEGCQLLAQQASSMSGNITLEDLHLGDNLGIGDKGVAILANLIATQLSVIHLDKCNISDTGCQALAQAAGHVTQTRLTILDLTRNPQISMEGASLHLKALLVQSPCMVSLRLPTHLSSLGEQLRTACPNATELKVIFR